MLTDRSHHSGRVPRTMSQKRAGASSPAANWAPGPQESFDDTQPTRSGRDLTQGIYRDGDVESSSSQFRKGRPWHARDTRRWIAEGQTNLVKPVRIKIVTVSSRFGKRSARSRAVAIWSPRVPARGSQPPLVTRLYRRLEIGEYRIP